MDSSCGAARCWGRAPAAGDVQVLWTAGLVGGQAACVQMLLSRFTGCVPSGESVMLCLGSPSVSVRDRGPAPLGVRQPCDAPSKAGSPRRWMASSLALPALGRCTVFHRQSGTLRMDGVSSCGQAPRAPRTLPLAGPELLLGDQLCCICLSICYFLRQLLGYTFSQLLLQPAAGMAFLCPFCR